MLGKSCSTAKVAQRWRVILCILRRFSTRSLPGSENSTAVRERLAVCVRHLGDGGGFSEYLAVREQNLLNCGYFHRQRGRAG